MTIFALIVGVVLGALGILLGIQNLGVVTLHLFALQFTVPLATLLIGTIGLSSVATILVLSPYLMRTDRYITGLLRRQKKLEDELSKYSITFSVAPPSQESVATAFEREKVVLPR